MCLVRREGEARFSTATFSESSHHTSVIRNNEKSYFSCNLPIMIRQESVIYHGCCDGKYGKQHHSVHVSCFRAGHKNPEPLNDVF